MVPITGTTKTAIVVVGDEVVIGRVDDEIGGPLSARLTQLGIEVIGRSIVRDRPDELMTQLRLRAQQGAELIVVTGGMGSTPDDVTVMTVAQFTKRELVADPELLSFLAQHPLPASQTVRRAWKTVGQRQARVPAGAAIVKPMGTAPAVVVPPQADEGIPAVVCLPGVPSEARGMFESVLGTAPMRSMLGHVVPLQHRIMRLEAGPAIDETTLGETLMRAEQTLDVETLSVNICALAGDAELILDTLFPSSALPQYLELEQFILNRHRRAVFALDGETVDEVVRMLAGDRQIGIIDLAGGMPLGVRLEDASLTAHQLLLPRHRTGGDTTSSRLTALLPADTHDARRLAAGACSLFGTQIGIGVVSAAGGSGLLDVAMRERSRRSISHAQIQLADDPLGPVRAATEAVHQLRRLLVPNHVAR